MPLHRQARVYLSSSFFRNLDTLCDNQNVLANQNTLHNFYTGMARVVLEKGVTANTRGHVSDDRMREADVWLTAAHKLGAHTAALNALTESLYRHVGHQTMSPSQLPDSRIYVNKYKVDGQVGRKYVQGPLAQVFSRRARSVSLPSTLEDWDMANAMVSLVTQAWPRFQVTDMV